MEIKVNDELSEIDYFDNDEIPDNPEENRCFIFSFGCADCFDDSDDLDNFGNENGRFGINYYYGDE